MSDQSTKDKDNSGSPSGEQNSNSNINVVHPEFEAVKKICDEAGIPCIGIFGVVPNEATKENIDAKLEQTAEILVKKNFQFLEEWTRDKEKNMEDYEAEFYKLCKEDDITRAKQLIIENRIDVHKPLEKNLQQYPIHIASRYGAPKITEFLVKVKKVNTNVTSFSGKTPLHYCFASAIGLKWVETCKILIENKNTDPNIRNNAQRLPVQEMIPIAHTENVHMEVPSFVTEVILHLYPLL